MSNTHEALLDTLPRAGNEAVKKSKQFRTKIPWPKGAMKGLCTMAIDKVLVEKMSLGEALKCLIQSERDYVMSVLAEYDEWLVENGFKQEDADAH